MNLNKIYTACFLSLFVLLSLGATAQKKEKKEKKEKKAVSEIKMIFPGLEDTVLYLASYYADMNLVYDTLYPLPHDPSVFVSRKDTLIPRGIYLLGNQNKVKLMDIVVDSSHSFTIETNKLNPAKPDIPSNVRFVNSPENETANTFFLTMSSFQRKIFGLNNSLKTEESSQTPDMALIEQYKTNRRLCQDSMRMYMRDFADENRHTLFGKAQLLMHEVEIPEPPRREDGSLVDSNFAYYYYINHYWDNADLTDPALIATPVFYPRLTKYFEDVVPPLVDSITKYADLLLNKVKDTPELFKYIVWYITNKYERSQYVAHDAVFVHMVENYYGKGLCPWTDEAVLERMINRATQLNPLLIGKTAPELYMIDTNGRIRSNYESPRKYTVMWFWDVNCGICKTSSPKLVEFYNRAKDSLDFEIYAICITPDMEKWKQTVREREFPWINVGGNQMNIDYRIAYDISSAPVIYVLDNEKKIIAKKISSDELESVLRSYDEGRVRY
ncbi:MAG: DUF5106 domain-containing protein [Bacteroidales bacterium]|jgi:hypothetical protein|nr:DUF5106 domain-containing protein [Bacteroidales bacterium]